MCAVPRCGGGADGGGGGGGEAMRFSVCVGGGGRPVTGASTSTSMRYLSKSARQTSSTRV